MGLRMTKQGSKRYRYLHAARLRKPRELVKYQHCPATGKVCYATQDEAILVLGKTQWSKDREKRHEKRVYQCPNCHQWHLTSVSQLSYKRYLNPREKAKVLLSRWKNLERFGGHIITAEEAHSFRESEAEWAESDNSERSFRREQPK